MSKPTRREGMSSPAARWYVIDALLNPVYVETCPCCGQDVERRGEPLISREAALEMLELSQNVMPLALPDAGEPE